MTVILALINSHVLRETEYSTYVQYKFLIEVTRGFRAFLVLVPGNNENIDLKTIEYFQVRSNHICINHSLHTS